MTEELCEASFSKSTVSQLCTALDARVRAFNELLLGSFPFVLIDAMYLKARDEDATGFSLHAGVATRAHKQDKLERLCLSLHRKAGPYPGSACH